ncbi:unnamed protein product [Penicillium olsonii]|uniref:Aminoglycoside phosphotransferase domain-containing protein n=1 Tax=Penicillium olsonii TaxID=99116 RepID=A0A9W4HNA4_PENOL|nr:unnamed protein product [Penicillium olsonii]CAG8277426.1 unnamed protein product [Penicillium olsonii]
MEPKESDTQGLAWVEKPFSLEPEWTVELDLEAIEQTSKSIYPAAKAIQVFFLAQGALNKLYDVTIDNETFIMRVSRPDDPYYKTMSEVSTLDWISRTTSIPVPRVISYQASRENPIGFEWIAMTKMPGKPSKEAWRSLPCSAKERLVEEFAVHFACLFQNKLQGIGNIYGTKSTPDDSKLAEATFPTVVSSSATGHSVLTTTALPISHVSDSTPPVGDLKLPTEDSASSKGDSRLTKTTLSTVTPACLNESPLAQTQDSRQSPAVGRIVSMQFFWGSNLHRDVHRGPFGSSRDWITSRLSLSEKEWQSKLDNIPAAELGRSDAADLDDATRTLKIIQKLQALLPSIFPPTSNTPEPSIMVHDDLSGQNILVSDTGHLTAALDWECVSALPLWIACNFPAFLHGPPRNDKPDREQYDVEEGEPEDGEPCDFYWENLRDYETTLLRDVFIETMKRLQPEWVDVFNKSQRERDLELAIQLCENEFFARDILAWVDDLAAGVENPRSLSDRMTLPRGEDTGVDNSCLRH